MNAFAGSASPRAKSEVPAMSKVEKKSSGGILNLRFFIGYAKKGFTRPPVSGKYEHHVVEPDLSYRPENPEQFASAFRALDAFGNRIGCVPVSVEPGKAVYELQVVPELYNPPGILHGGALFGAMDSCQGAAVYALLSGRAGVMASTARVEMRFRRPMREGRLLDLCSAADHKIWPSLARWRPASAAVGFSPSFL